MEIFQRTTQKNLEELENREKKNRNHTDIMSKISENIEEDIVENIEENIERQIYILEEK